MNENKKDRKIKKKNPMKKGDLKFQYGFQGHLRGNLPLFFLPSFYSIDKFVKLVCLRGIFFFRLFSYIFLNNAKDIFFRFSRFIWSSVSLFARIDDFLFSSLFHLSDYSIWYVCLSVSPINLWFCCLFIFSRFSSQ